MTTSPGGGGFRLLVQGDPKGVAVDDGHLQRSWAELDEQIRRHVALWSSLGITAGSHVAVLAHNRTELIEITLGAIAAGLWITPANQHLGPSEIAHQIDDSSCRALLVDPAHRSVADDALRHGSGLSHDDRATVSGVTPGETRSRGTNERGPSERGPNEQRAVSPMVIEIGAELDALLADVTPAPLEAGAPAGGPMLYTSGTTGRPKGVKRRRPERLDELIAGWRASALALGLDGRGPHLVTGPMYHAAPGYFAIYDLLNGSAVRIMARWDAQDFLRLVEGHRVTRTSMVPTMFVRLLALDETQARAHDLSSLGLVLHGAAPIAPGVKQRMIEWFGPTLSEYWGASESGVVTLVDSHEWLDHPGTVGRPLPGWEVVAVDQAGMPLPSGEVGALMCRRPDSTERHFVYHQMPEATDASHSPVLTDPPAFSLGDIGRVDPDRWVYLADRASHTIISGGVNIYPAEIAAVLLDHPSVLDVAVFGIPDEEWGERVHAVVELGAGVPSVPAADIEQELIAYVADHLARFKRPRSVEFVDALPRNPAGKIALTALKAPYWAGRSRPI